MTIMNHNYEKLQDSYLFYQIAKKVDAYQAANPDKKLYRMGIGDVSLPLCDEVIHALHEAVNEMSCKKTFQGYMPECGASFLQEAIAKHYEKRGVTIQTDEIFISSGASDDLGNLLHLFGKTNVVAIPEPAYPAYVDANLMDGRKIIHLPANEEAGFCAVPKKHMKADLIYLCSPANPTGAVYSKELLQVWVDFANDIDAIIVFDAAYEAFIEDDSLPHSIFELEGARSCAIEVCSLSKTAGFTGMRCGYTIIPKELKRDGMNLHEMWIRNRTTKSNGVSYVIQKGAAAVFTDMGQLQIRKNIQVYKQNAKYLMDALDETKLKYYGGKNAPYIWLKCPDSMDSWTFFDYLLQEIQLVGTPGSGFGACGEGYFRLSAFGDEADTKEAANRLCNLLKGME